MSDLIPIKQIYINPERQRTKPSEVKVAELAMSIQQHGLLHAVVVEPLNRVRFPDAPSHCTHRLVAGYRRLLSHALLKKPEIPFTLKEGLDALESEEIELDENLMREELPWQDEVNAKNRILAIRKQKYGEGIREVADHIGDSRGALWEDARLAEAMKAMPALANSKNKTQAQSKLRLALRRSALTEKADAIKSGKVVVSDDLSHKVWLGDSLQLAKNIPSETVHLILTDPPYGISLDIGETKKDSNHPTIYHDAAYDIHDLYALIAKEAFRILVPDAHAYFWFDIKAHSKILKILTDVGFLVDPIPLLWTKSQGQVNHPDTRWASCYETCFFCRKGARSLLKQGQSNVLTYDPVPPKQKIHPVEKPVALLRQLIESSTAPSEIVVDFFGGSGSTAEAAMQLNRDFIIIEKDEAYYAGILERLSKLTTNILNEQSPSFNKASDDYDPLATLEDELGAAQ